MENLKVSRKFKYDIFRNELKCLPSISYVEVGKRSKVFNYRFTFMPCLYFVIVVLFKYNIK